MHSMFYSVLYLGIGAAITSLLCSYFVQRGMGTAIKFSSIVKPETVFKLISHTTIGRRRYVLVHWIKDYQASHRRKGPEWPKLVEIDVPICDQNYQAGMYRYMVKMTKNPGTGAMNVYRWFQEIGDNESNDELRRL